MHTLLREVKLAARQSKASADLIFALTVAVALGVGANLAVVTLLWQTLARPSAFGGPNALVVVENVGPYHLEGFMKEGVVSSWLSGPDFDDIAGQVPAFAAIGAFDDSRVAVLRGAGRAQTVCRVLVSPTLLSTLRVHPSMGRVIGAADFVDHPGVAVITDSLWRHQFGADPAVLGRVVSLDEQSFTVVGVISSEVFGQLTPQTGLVAAQRDRCVVTPLVAGWLGEDEGLLSYVRRSRDTPWLRAVARLEGQASLASAQVQVATMAERLRRQHASTNRGRDLRVVSLQTWRLADVRPLLWCLALAAALTVLAVCATAIGLTTTECVRREPELALRQALGATTGQVLTVVAIRAALWSLPGGMCGIVLGWSLLQLLSRMTDAGPHQEYARLGAGPLVVAVGVTVLVGLVTGGWTAWTLQRRPSTEALREGAPSLSSSRRQNRSAQALMVVQAAAAVALAIGASFLLRSVWNQLNLDWGFDRHHGVVMMVRLPRSEYRTVEDQWRFYNRAVSRLSHVDGVTAVAASVSPPLTPTATSISGDLRIESAAGRIEPEHLNAKFVSAAYVTTLGIPLVRGRFFTDADEQTHASVAVVDQSFARQYLGRGNPVGATIGVGADTFTVVGVITDVRHALTNDGAIATDRSSPTVYFPFERLQQSPPWAFLLVRTAVASDSLSERLVREAALVEPLASIDEPRTFDQLFNAGTTEQRRLLALLSAFGAIVLGLTAVNLTTALTQFAAVRIREVAIRLALGATRVRILRLTARQVGTPLAAGLVTGVAAGILMVRLLASQLYGVTPFALSPIVTALFVCVGIGLLASAYPLWRVCQVRVIEALRAS
jgi:putative ABC transport system permease protein